MNKKEALVVITAKRSSTCKVEYETLEDLVSSVNELLTPGEEPLNPVLIEKDTRIRLSKRDGGGVYEWDDSLAHYCFGKGCISKARMVNELFRKEVLYENNSRWSRNYSRHDGNPEKMVYLQSCCRRIVSGILCAETGRNAGLFLPEFRRRI
jgi:hypothetical protein